MKKCIKMCPLCAEEIQDDAIKCPFCGEMLGETTRAHKQAPPPQTQAPPPQTQATPKLQEVTVVGITVPFGDVLWLALQWIVATFIAILLLVVLGAIGAFFVAVFLAIVGAFATN